MKDDEKDMLQFQMLQSNIEAANQKAKDIIRTLEELEMTKKTIESIKNIKKADAMIPLGSGIFSEGAVKDSGNLIISIGAGLAIKKSPEKATEITNKRITEAKNILTELTMQQKIMEVEAEKLRPKIQKILEK